MKRYKKTLNNCKIEVLEEQHFKGQSYKTCYFTVFTISWRFLHFVTVSYISCNLLKVVGTFSWKSFFLRFLMVLLAGWLAGWMAGWLTGWLRVPASPAQPAQPAQPIWNSWNQQKQLKNQWFWSPTGLRNQRFWSPTGFITTTRKGNKTGWTPTPLVFQWFFVGFRSFKRAGLAGLAELGWLGPAIQPASKTIRNLMKKQYLYEEVPTTLNEIVTT